MPLLKVCPHCGVTIYILYIISVPLKWDELNN